MSICACCGRDDRERERRRVAETDLATALDERDEAQRWADAGLRAAVDRDEVIAERDRLLAALMDVHAEAERLLRGSREELERHILTWGDDAPGRAFQEGVECAAFNLRDRAKAGRS